MRLWRPDLKVWRRLMQPLLSVLRLTVGRVTKDHILALSHFAQACSRLAIHRGSRGLTLYLKVAHVLLMQGLPGSLMKPNSRDIGKTAVSTSRDGLPRLIPKRHRALIRRGDRTIIRLWLTLLGLYRILHFKWKVNLKAQFDKNIARPGVVFSDILLGGFMIFVRKYFIPSITKQYYDEGPLLDLDPATLKPEPLPLTSSGSASIRVKTDARLAGDFGTKDDKDYVTSSFESRGRSARAWTDGKWGESLWDYLAHIKQVNTTLSFWRLIETEAELADKSARPLSVASGRLSVKMEPAGKVRVFAITDYWTQCALKPLHDFIFGILEVLPTDGTFDQHKPVKALLSKLPEGEHLYSFDLSAATDRFPVVLQEVVIGAIFGWEYAYHWKNLLVARAYKAPLKGLVTYKYAVGQPMGALSSWAVFSLTHHALVQFAAYLSGHRGFFTLYALLGDDVVIATDKVAAKYRRLCDLLGIEIGIAKSMISGGKSCEFAKVVYVAGEPCHAFPWKLWAVSQTSLSACLAAVQRATFSGVRLTASQVALAFGAGMKATHRVGAKWVNIPSRLRALLVILSHPSAQTSISRPTWIDWLAVGGPSLPVQFAENVQLQFTGWCQALLTEFLMPIRERIEDIQSDFFFGTSSEVKNLKIPTPVERFIDSKVNKSMVEFEESADKAEASLKHLSKLNIRFRADQASHVFTQVVGVIEERASQISRFREGLGVSSDSNAKVKMPFSNIYRLWERWRVRAFRAIALAKKGVGRESSPGSVGGEAEQP